MNKIVDYYKPNDERLSQYYWDYLDLLGLDKHPYGPDQNGTLRFDSHLKSDRLITSNIWKDYISNGNFENGIGDYNKLWADFQKGKYTLDEFMQFYREDGCSLLHLIEVFSSHFYEAKNTKELQAALDKLQITDNIEQAKQDILDTLFLAHMDGVEDELMLKYRIGAKKIVNEKFGDGTWTLFVNTIRNKKNER